MEFNRILFPVDFSDLSAACLEKESEVLAHDRMRVTHFLYVLHTPTDFSDWSGDPKIEIQRRLNELMGRFEIKGSFQTTAVVRTGHASTEICKYATVNGCDIIVMATHGRTGLAHMLMGSTAEQVVRHAPCPVLTLRVKPS